MAQTILICSNVYPPRFIGGAELIAHYQAKLLKQRGHNVIVFAGEGDGPRGVRHSMRQDEYEGLPVFRVSLQPEDYQPNFASFAHPAVETHFHSLLDAFAPDVVHMHNIVGLSAGLIHAAKQKGARTVLTLHDYWGICYKNTLIKQNNEVCEDFDRCSECMQTMDDGADRNLPIRMRRDFLSLQFKEVDAFISPSLYLAEIYVRAGVPIEKMNVIWNGVDVNRFSSLTKKGRSSRIRFTFIGHFGSHKGIDVLLDALALVQSSGRASLNLVGTGERVEEIKRRVVDLDLSPVVKFWGKVENSRIDEVFRETDVQILPSLWPENQPVSITEAMATRTPVIASALGGIPELVINGETGYVFQPGSAAQLADKMWRFIADPDRIETFGERGFERIRDKSFDHQIDKICQLYG